MADVRHGDFASQLLLKEVVRVLRPGGKLVCYGPLMYLFSNPIGQLSPGEARHGLAAFGLRIDEELTTRLPFQVFPDSGLERTLHIWSYVATRE